jgi:prefoldin subunit 5
VRRRRQYESPFSLFAFQDIITSVTGILILMTLLLTLALVTREFATPSLQSAAVAEDVSHVIEQTSQEVATLHQRLDTSTEQLAAIADIASTRVRREVHDLQQQIDSVTTQVDAIENKVARTEESRREWATRLVDVDKIEQDLKELQREHARLTAERQKLEQEDRLIYNPQQMAGKTAWLVDVGQGQVLAARIGVKEQPRQFQRPADFIQWAKTRDGIADYFVLLVRPAGIETYESIFSALRDAGYDLGVDLIGQQQTVIDPRVGAGGAG